MPIFILLKIYLHKKTDWIKSSLFLLGVIAVYIIVVKIVLVELLRLLEQPLFELLGI